MRVKLETNGADIYVILPRDFLDRHGLKVGDSVALTALVEPRLSPTEEPVHLSPEEEADFEEQLEAARIGMQKYKTALNRLADS
jgi:hypothetical protein